MMIRRIKEIMFKVGGKEIDSKPGNECDRKQEKERRKVI